MIVRLLFVFGLLVTLLPAQEPAIIKTKFVTCALGALPDDFSAFYKTGETVEEFMVSAASLGIPINYQGPRRFILHKSKADFAKPKDGEAPKPPLAWADLPEKSELVLLLCVPESEGKIRLLAYDISPKDLAAGDYKMFNFSHSTISVIMGKQKFTLAPGKQTLVKDDGWKTEVVALPFQIATVVDNKPNLVYSSFWEHYPVRRNLMFMFDGVDESMPIMFNHYNAGFPTERKAEESSSASPAE